jgi:3-hydroxymyristoyl/3-hydroxydecanoyl-(acyl carrier protein) dehydratase
MQKSSLTPHFAAYSFVDRIVEFVPGKHARATFAIPAGIAAFPGALVAEAVGQLAAWVAMDSIDFRGRPVAALATETRFLGDAKPGDTLDLAIDIIDCDDDAVAYNGHASVGGRPVIELVDCLGPMLPVAEFDDPEALRERLRLLRGRGATPGRFAGVGDFPMSVTSHVPGSALCATLEVPAAAPFFADHFPRRPVFPATLLLDAQMRLALDLAGQSMQNGARPLRLTHVKMRSFIVPAQRLDIGVTLAAPENGMAKAMLTAKTDDRLVASARLELAAPHPPRSRSAPSPRTQGDGWRLPGVDRNRRSASSPRTRGEGWGEGPRKAQASRDR